LERAQPVTDYETAQKRRNLIVGVFVLVAMGALVWLIYKFEALPTRFSELRSYQIMVQFPTARGVQKNTPVYFCGYQIGRVTSVKPPQVLEDRETGQYYYQTVVVLSIDKSFDDIPAEVEVKLMTRGLGSSYIELTSGPFKQDSKREFLTPGTPLQGKTGTTSEFFPEESQKKLDILVNGLNTLVDNANDILGDQANKENLKSTLANLSLATEQAGGVLEEFEKLTAAGTETLKNIDIRVEKLVTALVDVSEQLSKAISQLRVTAQKINDGQGTAGRFINDGRLYENLLENTRQIETLLEELRLFVAKSRDEGLPIKLK